MLLEKSTWYLDSGCSRHMTRDSSLLKEIIFYAGPKISFGDNSKGKVMGKGKITHGNLNIEEVLLVGNLHYNLISSSQLCENNHVVEFHKEIYYIKNQYGITMLTRNRLGNVYKLN